MNSGQEGLMAVREERVREGGIEKTSTTFVAATDEGVSTLHYTQINTAGASGVFQPTVPRMEAWLPHPAPIAPPGILPSAPQLESDARKKSCSNCLENFCCLYDTNSKWYEFSGKGFWCVLFLLVGYLIVGVIVFALAILYFVCKVMEALDSRANSSRRSSTSSCSC
ncbi:uncharacterized protein LOC110046286 [Orbicella faveolata]|uniref:uncharacterized protein LOC110046286 n=1 Tax=Orbicella faveolata TaxID=48498 RepID=UPI0009E302C3|nr:uncharacterized protein LOC110046286 [Orbicella faveolata]